MNARTLTLPALMIFAALMSACTTMSPQPASTVPVVLGLQRIQQAHENLDRYTCGNAPLSCTCFSLMRSAPCDCACPRY